MYLGRILFFKHKECVCVYIYVYVLPADKTLANFDITVIVRNISNSPETLFVTTQEE